MSLAINALSGPAEAEKFITQGKVHFFRGQRYPAQMAFARAIVASPDDSEAKALFMESVAAQGLQSFSPVIRQAIEICLADPDVMHLRLFFAWHSTAMHDPALRLWAELQSLETYEAVAEHLSEFDYADILNDGFVLSGLRNLLMKESNLEKILTHLRRYFLLDENPAGREAMAPFLTSLALQCFFNEYIFYISEAEQAHVDRLLTACDRLDPLDIMILSCYVPLFSLENANDLAGKLRASGIEGAEAFVRVQIDEPLQEKEIRSQIRGFGNISNAVSQAVQQQYEEHPFPRWIACGGIVQGNDRKGAGKKILIAGCGTGQQSTVAAMRFPQASVTAIDLSRASLAYAMRKAQHYNLNNISYRHGDILEVSALGQVYDYIACGGVLHHMDLPKDGLKSLKESLAPHGVLRIALYSEIARRNIVTAQQWIQEQDIPSTLPGIRNFRKSFVGDLYAKIFVDRRPFFDHFSASECRDLFFHVQEHRFTCLTLRDMLEELNLELLFFAPEAQTHRKKYMEMFPGDPLALNLANWHEFEKENPDIFIGMYKFYAGHKGAHEPGRMPAWVK